MNDMQTNAKHMRTPGSRAVEESQILSPSCLRSPGALGTKAVSGGCSAPPAGQTRRWPGSREGMRGGAAAEGGVPASRPGVDAAAPGAATPSGCDCSEVGVRGALSSPALPGRGLRGAGAHSEESAPHRVAPSRTHSAHWLSAGAPRPVSLSPALLHPHRVPRVAWRS